MTYKKLYSLNLVSYIYLISNEEPIMGKDPNTGSIYFLYPDDDTTNFLIATYKNGNPKVGLKDLTKSYSHVRAMMRAFRYSGAE